MDEIKTLREMEKEAILKTLDTGISVTEAAKVLGIARASMYRKLNKYGIDIRARVRGVKYG